tara:strand:+ start:151 stop:657 length:507 start_codon:yes stop_codon:yes gene_type:complete
MKNNNQIELNFKVKELYDIWSLFCEQHTALYELTCDEYMQLLSSEIDDLELTVQKKNLLITQINQLDQKRTSLTTEVSEILGLEDSNKFSLLINELKEATQIKEVSNLEKMNLVLLDIIEKIQEQNKKNQVFLNKAIHSLKELKDSFTGKTTYNTYSSSGMTNNSKTY